MRSLNFSERKKIGGRMSPGIVGRDKRRCLDQEKGLDWQSGKGLGGEAGFCIAGRCFVAKKALFTRKGNFSISIRENVLSRAGTKMSVGDLERASRERSPMRWGKWETGFNHSSGDCVFWNSKQSERSVASSPTKNVGRPVWKRKGS